VGEHLSEIKPAFFETVDWLPYWPRIARWAICSEFPILVKIEAFQKFAYFEYLGKSCA
jgi:hypothetical protein